MLIYLQLFILVSKFQSALHKNISKPLKRENHYALNEHYSTLTERRRITTHLAHARVNKWVFNLDLKTSIEHASLLFSVMLCNAA